MAFPFLRWAALHVSLWRSCEILLSWALAPGLSKKWRRSTCWDAVCSRCPRCPTTKQDTERYMWFVGAWSSMSRTSRIHMSSKFVDCRCRYWLSHNKQRWRCRCRCRPLCSPFAMGLWDSLHVLIFSVFSEVRVREMAKRFESCETQKATRSRETEALRLRCKQYLSTYFASKRENTLNWNDWNRDSSQ